MSYRIAYHREKDRTSPPGFGSSPYRRFGVPDVPGVGAATFRRCTSRLSMQLSPP